MNKQLIRYNKRAQRTRELKALEVELRDEQVQLHKDQLKQLMADMEADWWHLEFADRHYVDPYHHEQTFNVIEVDDHESDLNHEVFDYDPFPIHEYASYPS